MRKHRSYPVEFKRQVAQEYLAGETLHGLAKRHEINRNLVRIWVAKFEAGSFDNDVIAAKGAGVPSILVAYGYANAAPGELGANVVIERFADLPAVLAQLP